MLLLVLGLVAVSYCQDLVLVWSDEFDGDEIDLSKWQHEVTAWGGGNGEFQVYTPMANNSWVEGGVLHLKPTRLVDNTNPETGEPFGDEFLANGELDLEDMFGYCTVPDNNGCFRTGRDLAGLSIPPIASARLRTADRFSYRYGRVEINAKMPVGDWLWPALWLLPEEWKYGDWPISGEIDIVEIIGNRNYYCEEDENRYYRDIHHMGVAMHWGVSGSQNRYYLTNDGIDNHDNNYGDYFHLYRLDWTPQGFGFYCDDVLVMAVPDPPILDRDSDNCWEGFYEFGKPWTGPPETPWPEEDTCTHYMAPFDQPFHFLFNVAVGGTNWFIPDNCVNRDGDPGHEKPWNNGVSQETGMWDFYDAQSAWYPTWTAEGANNHMQVDYIRVWQEDGYGRTQVPEGCPEPPGPDNCN